MSDNQIGSVIAGGGVSSAIIASLYMLYKCCYRRKFRSKCCGATMDLDESQPSPTQSAPPTIINVQPSPALKAEKAPELELPQLDLAEHVRH